MRLKLLRLSRCAGAALLAWPASAAHADDAPAAIRPFDIATTQILGRAIYDQDQMAWKASDVLTGTHAADALKADKVHGWIVTTAADRNVVRFIDDGANGPEIYCDVAFAPAVADACVTPQDRTLSSDELAQYNARLTALAGVERRCTERYNSVALKDPQRDGWLVWALAATNVPGTVVYGGHYRFSISSDGKSITQRDALSRGCTQTPPPDAGKPAPVALFFIQLVANTPIETAVWLSLQHHLPIYLATPDRKLWRVTGDKIDFRTDIPPPAQGTP